MVQFADRMNRVSGEAVREILAMMANTEIVSFGGGSPAKETFPVDVIKEIVDSSLSRNPAALLQYGVTDGWMPLRKAYLEHMVHPKGVKADLENVIILTGSTQGLDLLSEVFLDPGDCILVESPTFLGTLSTFKKFDAHCIAVQVDDDGMVIEDLEEKMKQHRPKMLYTIPTFQNPTGRTIPAERRKKIAALAVKYDVLVLEDDPYCDLRYRGHAVPPIKSFDESGHVVLLNSFSKIVSPGLRVGAMTAAPHIIRKISDAKQLADTHTPNLPQEICAEFLSRGLLPGHLKAITPLYAERMDTMLSGIAQHFPKSCKYTEPEGGLFVWVKLPDHADAQALLKRAVSELKVAFIPGRPFFINPEEGNSCIRLNFSSNPPETIAKGMETLGNFFTEALQGA